jgi:hypothetical protein
VSNEFLSLRNSNRPKTQAEVDAYVADEPDRAPYGGAGSFAGHARRASKQYTPTSARARMTEAERKQFAAENQEPIYTSPEDRARIDAIVADTLKRDDIQRSFANAVRKNQPLDDLWSRAGGEGDLFEGFERDGDPTGAPEAQIIAAWKTFAESPIFSAYYTLDKTSPRGKVLGKTMDLLYNFQTVNLINMTLASSWAKSFGLLNGIGILPAPVPTDAQLRAIENSKPAQDGNPVAINDATGQPVTYTFKDGRVVRYSKQMLNQLNAESYAKVMNLHAAPKETEDQRRARKAHEYRTVIVAKGFTQKDLDAMTSERYREVMELSRAPMAMKPFERL